MMNALSLTTNNTLTNACNIDSTLSLDLFNCFTQRIPSLAQKDQARVYCVAKCQAHMEIADDEFKKLLGPELMQRTVALDGVQTFHSALSAAFFVWSLNQEWAYSKDVDPSEVADVMVEHAMESASETSALVACNMFMGQLVPLIEHIPKKTQAGTVTDILHRIYRLSIWQNRQPAALSARYLELSHALMSYYPQVPMRNDLQYVTSAVSCWKESAALTIGQSYPGEQEQLAAWLAQSPLPHKDKLNVLSECSAEVWAKDIVATVLSPQLAENEWERFELLPWSAQPGAGACNRALVQAYCPTMFPLIDLGVDDQAWTHRPTIAAMVATVAHPHMASAETLDLPDDCTPHA